MKELKKEDGITQISLENLALLAVLHGPVRFMLHHAPHGTTVRDYTLIVFQDGTIHRATGFSSGYRGEGPHGLLTAIEKWLKRRDITIEHINKWRGKQYLLLSDKGNGQRLCHLEDRIEVW